MLPQSRSQEYAALATDGLELMRDRIMASPKQAKDVPRQVLMARIGIHHRLVFRTGDRALDVLDLVTRESLPTVLKRLRMP
jgi:hypothetical protein